VCVAPIASSPTVAGDSTIVVGAGGDVESRQEARMHSATAAQRYRIRIMDDGRSPKRATPSLTFGMEHGLGNGPVLLYDGLCGFCNGTVQFVLARDRRGVMRFATLQGEFARGIVARHPELAGVDSLILVETIE